MRNYLKAAILSGALSFALASPASGAVTIGSDLAPAPAGGLGCPTGPACTWSNTALSGASTASPIDGVVVRWRVRVAAVRAGGSTIGLKVIRPAGADTFTALNRSADEFLSESAVDTTHTFSTSQRIAAGDFIALDADAVNVGGLVIEAYAPVPGNTQLKWDPALGIGETAAPTNTYTNNGELLINADVEPDCDGDGRGDETQDTDISSCAPPDADPPQTRIMKRPANRTSRHTVKYRFVADEPGATFECKRDRKPFRRCSSPKKVRVGAGKHKFKVRAIDLAGNVDASPARDRFKVVDKKRP